MENEEVENLSDQVKKLTMDNEKLQQDLKKEGRRVLLRTLVTKEMSRSAFHYRS